MAKMTVKEILAQVTFVDGMIKSNSTGNLFTVKDFVDTISVKVGLNKSEKMELLSHFSDSLKPQSDASEHIEKIIEKYKFQFSDGVYIINGNVITLDEIYRLLWKEEKLLPTETDYIVENIEKISETIPLQENIFNLIKSKAKSDANGKIKSKYLESLYKLYPNEKWHDILYNILVPDTKPFFHLFYDDGVGGTGKSTILEVITKIVGENFTSNVLLDQFGNRFVFANMLGKYVNVGDDNGKTEELQNVGTLKSIITRNRVTVDRKNISPIEVRIFAKQLYATNLFPYIDFTDGGIMRRLNIISMNKVIPPDFPMCELDDNEIGLIITEVLNYGKDLEKNSNQLAIILNPLYRFFTIDKKSTYDEYKTFCSTYGFRQMNIINFEVKSKFVRHYILSNQKNAKQEKIDLDKLKPTNEELPF